jgi:hypothetical protein
MTKDDEMTDQQFLGYVELHSKTPRALFSNSDVCRFLVLAGEQDIAVALHFGFSGFTPMHYDEIQGFLEQARKRLEVKRICGACVYYRDLACWRSRNVENAVEYTDARAEKCGSFRAKEGADDE